MIVLSTTKRLRALRCCAEGVLSCPKLQKMKEMKLCCFAVDNVLKWIGRGPERNSFATYIKTKYYAKDRSVLKI